MTIAWCKQLHVATNLNEACSYPIALFILLLRENNNEKNLSKFYKILMGMDLLYSKIKVTHVNRKSACQREIFPFTVCVRQETRSCGWKMSTVYSCKTAAGDVTMRVTAGSAFLHAGMSMSLVSRNLKALFVEKMRFFRTNTLSLNHHSF